MLNRQSGCTKWAGRSNVADSISAGEASSRLDTCVPAEEGTLAAELLLPLVGADRLLEVGTGRFRLGSPCSDLNCMDYLGNFHSYLEKL